MIDHDFGSNQARQPELKAEDKPDAAAQLGTIIYSLLRSRKLIINAAIIGAIAGFVQGALQPNVYRSTGKLMVRVGMRETASTEVNPLGGGQRASLSSSEAIANELHILRNPKLMRAVARRVGGTDIIKMRDPSASDGPGTPAPTRLLHEFQAWWFGLEESDQELAEVSEEPEYLISAAASVIASNLRVTESFGSNILDISYNGQTPQISQLVVDTFLEEAVDHHREFFTSEPQLAFLKKQGVEAKEASDAANLAFSQFKIQTGIYDLDATKSSLITSIKGLENKIATDQMQRNGLQKGLEFVNERIQEEDPTKAEKLALRPNPEYSRIESQLTSMRLRQMDFQRRTNESQENLLKRKGDLDDLIRSLESQLSQLEQYLPADNPRYTALLTRREAAMEQILIIDATKEDQATLLEIQRANLVKLQEAEPKYMELMLRADQTLTSVDAFYSTLERLGFMSLLDEEELGNLRILQTSSDGDWKLSPNRPRVLAMGGIMGLMIGVMLAFARGFLDPYLRRPGELKSLGGGAVLGVVKELGRKVPLPIVSSVNKPSPWEILGDGLWAHLRKVCPGKESARIAFTSVGSGSGVSSVVASAGIGLARRLRERVLIIETGFGSPGLADRFDLDSGPGLSDVLSGDAQLRDAIRKTSVPGLSILGVGEAPDPGPGWCASGELTSLLADIESKYRFVLMDVAPVSSDPEQRLVLWDSDALVLVVQAGKSRKSEIKGLLESLNESGLPLLGSVVNRYRSARPFWLPGSDSELTVAHATCASVGKVS